MKIKTYALILVGLTFCLIGGGPWVVDDNNAGTPLKWLGNKIVIYTDPGHLNDSVNNADALEMIQNGINAWTTSKLTNKDGVQVPVVNMNVTMGGNVEADINSTNYKLFFGNPSAKTVIIFDKDGKIWDTSPEFEDLQDAIAVTFSPILTSDKKNIRQNVIFFNGPALSEYSRDLLQAVITHELGHLFNLDHSQVNQDSARYCESDTCDNANRIPTMWPVPVTTLQKAPKYDDKIALASLYPTTEFNEQFCTIEGEIKNSDGCPIQGVHVVAWRAGESDDMALVDARGMISGVMYGACDSADGHYYLKGIVPGKSYKVGYEATLTFNNTASCFEPLGQDSPQNISEDIITSDGQEVVKCENGGDVIHMDDVNIGVKDYACETMCGDYKASGSATNGSSKGCSLTDN